MEMTDSQAVAVDLSEWASQGDWRLFFLMRDRIKAVTEADVLRVAKAYLKESNRTVGTFIPTKRPGPLRDSRHPRHLCRSQGLQGHGDGRRKARPLNPPRTISRSAW